MKFCLLALLLALSTSNAFAKDCGLPDFDKEEDFTKTKSIEVSAKNVDSLDKLNKQQLIMLVKAGSNVNGISETPGKIKSAVDAVEFLEKNSGTLHVVANVADGDFECR